MNNQDAFEHILASYLKDLEGARNTSTRADSLVTIREHLINMNYFADYERKIKSVETK